VPCLNKTLSKKLKNAKRVFVLGIGSELLADDCAGLLVAQQLKGPYLPKNRLSVKFKALPAGNAPENFTGEIKKFKPTHLIIIDAADLGKNPGAAAVFAPSEATGISFSTHRLPCKIMADYLAQSLACEIIMIGIQPKSLLFGKPVCKAVEKSVKSLVGVIRDCLTKPAR
jgi:hydrogenase 3 maturation protease